MKIVNTPFLAILALAVLSLVACKPSVEGETTKWTENKKSIESLKASHPQFADAITEVETAATAAWAEAEKVADEEKKSEAMAAVNSTISASCVHYLEDIPSIEKDIEAVSDKFAGKRMSKSLLSRLENAEEAAYDKIRSARSAIATGAATAVAAKELLEPHHSALSSSKSKMNSLWSAYKKEQKKKKKK